MNSYAQTDNNGNPIFNSISINEQQFTEYNLISNYYTLINNIENKNSSVYVSDTPTLNEIETSAIKLPSDFFIIAKLQNVSHLIMLVSSPEKKFRVINIATENELEFDCDLNGDITENRANEIIQEKFDPKAKIESGILHFNGKKLKIIPNESINNAVLSLIMKEKFYESQPSEFKIPTKDELKEIILKESTEGGKFDFFSEIKEKEYNGVQIKPGVFTTLESIALYKWGRANYDLGINTIEDAYAIYAEFRNREITDKEKAYIKKGFEKEWEK